MTTFYNRTTEKEKRRELRRTATPAEKQLWARLRADQLDGFQFRRQYSIGPYILDFYCPSCRVAVELDGASHDSDEAQAYDAERQQYVEAFGIRFLRFPNRQVYTNIESVLEAIHIELTRTRSVREPPPTPP
jgi:very-short-patch-repair endonuclease